MELKIFLIISVVLEVKGDFQIPLNNPNPAFDDEFYKSVLDPKECEKQLDYLKNNTIQAIRFIDAGAKFPQGMLGGNLVDFGSYHLCLSINHEAEGMAIQGKYCFTTVDLASIIELPFKKTNLNATIKMPHECAKMNLLKNAENANTLVQRIKKGESLIEIFKQGIKNSDFHNGLTLKINLGMCIPKPCTMRQVFNSSLSDLPVDSVFSEDFYRLPNDKPWSPADTTAAVILSIMGILTLVCTSYDVTCKFILKRDAKDTNSHLQMFSAYTNGCRLVSFPSGPGVLRCIDGIRVLATAWVVLGHSVSIQFKNLNMIDIEVWARSLHSVYITSAPMTVDTFFTMAGLLLVYILCGKLSRKELLRNLHLFYLNRLLRMFPLLATVVLLQASFFHRMSDGPMWTSVPNETNNCRTQWWITLLYLQNFINSSSMCLPHTWFLPIDFQLYVLSPLVLFWVLGDSKKAAWAALAAGLLVALTGATIYNFRNISYPRRLDEIEVYMKYYYINTLCRASPFFVGMMFGYLLHIYRGKRVHLAWNSVVLLWSSTAVVMIIICLLSNFMIQDDWNHKMIDKFLHSFMRPVWGAAIGWIVFACVHGYGGPVNRFLSLDIWRLPARLCYGVYLFHHPLIEIVSDSVTSPVFFAPPRFLFMFIAYLSISFIISYFATLTIDIPIAMVVKKFFEIERQKARDGIIKDLPKQIQRVTIEDKVNLEKSLPNERTFNPNSKLFIPKYTVTNANYYKEN